MYDKYVYLNDDTAFVVNDNGSASTSSSKTLSSLSYQLWRLIYKSTNKKPEQNMFEQNFFWYGQIVYPKLKE